jgi:hypothetical protein
MGHGCPLEPPDISSTRNPQFATRSMGVAETSPSVLWRDGERTYKLVGEPAPIASNGPRLGGSTHGYTSWGAPNANHARYVRVVPPRPAEISLMPAEINTPHTGRTCEKTLQEHPRSYKASGARPAGPLAWPHGIAPATRGRKSHLQASASAGSSRIHPQMLGGYCRGQPYGSPKQPGKTHLPS